MAKGGYLKWKAERSKHRAIERRRRDTPNWPVLANAISRTLCTRGLRSDLLAWRKIWSVSGVSELVGTSCTENRKRAGHDQSLCRRRVGARLTRRAPPHAPPADD